MRIRLLLAAALLLTPTGCGASGPQLAISPSDVTDPIEVLHRWDAARSQAWEEADPVALAALYLPGSRIGLRDVALLKRYVARGVRLSDLQMQVLSAQTVMRRPDQLRIIVVERFAGAQVAVERGQQSLPAGVPSRRVVDLKRIAGKWVVVSVRR